jgi:hypothetical protein
MDARADVGERRAGGHNRPDRASARAVIGVSTWENTYRGDGDLVADPSFVPPPPVCHLVGYGWSEGFSVRGAESCTCKSVSGVSP